MTDHVKCPICGQQGVLMWKNTMTRANGMLYHYRKLYCYHCSAQGQKWHYINSKKAERLDLELHKTATQKMQNQRASFQAQTPKMEPRAGFEPATPALPRRSPTGLGYRGACTFDI
jgi:hypothetical protein